MLFLFSSKTFSINYNLQIFVYFHFSVTHLSNQTLSHLCHSLVIPYEFNVAFYVELARELTCRGVAGDGPAAYALCLAENLMLDPTRPPQLHYLASHPELLGEGLDYVFHLHYCFPDVDDPPDTPDRQRSTTVTPEQQWFYKLPSQSPLLPPPPAQYALRSAQRKELAQLYCSRYCLCPLVLAYFASHS